MMKKDASFFEERHLYVKNDVPSICGTCVPDTCQNARLCHKKELLTVEVEYTVTVEMGLQKNGSVMSKYVVVSCSNRPSYVKCGITCLHNSNNK